MSSSNKNNSIKLINALTTLLPPLFLEARVFGGGGKQLEMITQLGLSFPASENMDIAIFTRTSGAAFAVGIGSFVAYKMLCKLIKSNCIWSTLEQLSPPEEEQNEHKASVSSEPIIIAEGFYAVRLGGENELLRKLDEFLSASTTSEEDNKEIKPRVAVVQVRQANALRRLFRRNQRLQQKGIASIDQQINNNKEENNEQKILSNAIASRGEIIQYGSEALINRKRLKINENEEENLSDCSQISFNTSISRALYKNEYNNDSDSSSSIYSKTNSNKSASLHLNCENELFWEDEFYCNEKQKREEEDDEFIDDDGLFIFREREGSLGGLSQLSAMKNLEKMFSNDWLIKNNNEEDIDECNDDNKSSLLDNALDNLREMASLDDVINSQASCSSSLHNISQIKQNDYFNHYNEDERKLPFTAYRIVLQNELSETSSSLCGGSTRSDRFGRYCCPSSPHRQQRKRLEATPVSISQGLWELTSSDNNTNSSRLTSEKQCLKIYERKEMVDSIISINSHASSSMTTSSSAQIQMPHSGVMIDSAIGTDFQSSADDDDLKEQYVEEGEFINEGITRLRTKSGIFRRYCGEVESNKGIILRPLSKINEQQSTTTTPVKLSTKTTTPSTLIKQKSNTSSSSIEGSESSLEWF